MADDGLVDRIDHIVLTVAAIEAEFHVTLTQRSRDAIAVTALAAILARTS